MLRSSPASLRCGRSPDTWDRSPLAFPNSAARLTALIDHDHFLLVEAGAGSGKTALMAGRVAMLLTAGVPPRDIVAITFTEAAASELLERIERFAGALLGGTIPRELRDALPAGLSAAQHENIELGAQALDEITCTTIHGFCQQLVRPYPVETGIDPGAEIIDPAAAELAFQDLMDAWLSARFGRDRSSEGLGRIPPMTGAGGSEDFFAELVNAAPDAAVDSDHQSRGISQRSSDGLGAAGGCGPDRVLAAGLRDRRLRRMVQWLLGRRGENR